MYLPAAEARKSEKFRIDWGSLIGIGSSGLRWLPEVIAVVSAPFAGAPCAPALLAALQATLPQEQENAIMTPSPTQGISPPGAGAVRIEPIAAFRDNYIWLLERGGHAVVVDPGDAVPVLQLLAARQWRLDAILLTHHHSDHVGGVADLVRAHPARVYGPAHSPYTDVDVRLREGDTLNVLDTHFAVLEVPGHTLDHIAYWSANLGALFCGDTLFACGCGRLFEGSPAQMSASLAKIAALPGSTRAFCAHEYTLSNLRFALAVEPGNAALLQRRDDCLALRERGEPTVPSTLEQELATNPFLRCAQPDVVAAARRQQPTAGDVTAVFAALRAWKDRY
jgi:hydroxyacylglutathione hydrolase